MIDGTGIRRDLEKIEWNASLEKVFPETVTNILDHVTTYDYTNGRLTSFTDANNQTITIVYDELGRRQSWTHSSGSQQTYAYTDADDGKPSFIETDLKRYDVVPSGEFGSIQQLAAYSPLGQELAKMEIAETPGQVRVLSRKVFNRNKKAVNEYVPYVVTDTFAAIRTAGIIPDAPGSHPMTSFIWDGLGRITQVTHPGLATGVERATVETKTWRSWGEQVSKEYYDGNSARINSCKEFVRRGEAVYGVIDELACGGNGSPHQFQRDPGGNLAAIRLAGEPKDRTFRFDGFGRMQQQVIPGVGAYYFVHDSWGNLIYQFQFDNNGLYVSGVENTYDELNRLTARDTLLLSNNTLTAGVQVEQRSYDAYSSGSVQTGSLAQPLGMMTQVQTVDTNNRANDYTERLEYNTRGELVYKTVSIGNSSGWAEAYERTLDGTIRSITNSENVVAEYGLTASMKMRSVKMSFDNGSNFNSIISGVTYNGKGQLERIDYHDDGAFTNLQYDTNTLRLKRILSESSQDLGSGSKLLQDLTLSYNGNNSIVAIADAVGTTSWGHINRNGKFEYNARDELTRVYDRYNDDRSYRYNAAGAFTRNDDIFGDDTARGDLTQTIHPDTGLIPRGTTDNPSTFDDAGRLSANTTVRSTLFDHNNRLIRTTTGTQTVYYGYNHEGNRIYKEVVTNADASSKTSLYPLKTLNKEPSGRQSYVFIGDQRLARVEHDNNNRWFYYLKDHLGSSDIIMTGGNAGEFADLPVEQMAYRAYGTEYQPEQLAQVVQVDGQDSDAWTVALDTRREAGVTPVERTHHRFTGQYLDDDTGLYYYGQRYYDPGLGRFISADRYFIEGPEECVRSPLECGLYGYARNNPVKFTDPTGEWSIGVRAGGSVTTGVGRVSLDVGFSTVIDENKSWLDPSKYSATINASGSADAKAGGFNAEGGVSGSVSNATHASQLVGHARNSGFSAGNGAGITGEVSRQVDPAGNPVRNSSGKAVIQASGGAGLTIGASGYVENKSIAKGIVIGLPEGPSVTGADSNSSTNLPEVDISPDLESAPNGPEISAPELLM